MSNDTLQKPRPLPFGRGTSADLDIVIGLIGDLPNYDERIKAVEVVAKDAIDKVGVLETKVDTFDSRITGAETVAKDAVDKVGVLETKVDTFDSRITGAETVAKDAVDKVGVLETKVDTFDSRITGAETAAKDAVDKVGVLENSISVISIKADAAVSAASDAQQAAINANTKAIDAAEKANAVRVELDARRLVPDYVTDTHIDFGDGVKIDKDTAQKTGIAVTRFDSFTDSLLGENTRIVTYDETNDKIKFATASSLKVPDYAKPTSIDFGNPTAPIINIGGIFFGSLTGNTFITDTKISTGGKVEMDSETSSMCVMNESNHVRITPGLIEMKGADIGEIDIDINELAALKEVYAAKSVDVDVEKHKIFVVNPSAKGSEPFYSYVDYPVYLKKESVAFGDEFSTKLTNNSLTIYNGQAVVPTNDDVCFIDNKNIHFNTTNVNVGIGIDGMDITRKLDNGKSISVNVPLEVLCNAPSRYFFYEKEMVYGTSSEPIEKFNFEGKDTNLDYGKFLTDAPVTSFVVDFSKNPLDISTFDYNSREPHGLLFVIQSDKKPVYSATVFTGKNTNDSKVTSIFDMCGMYCTIIEPFHPSGPIYYDKDNSIPAEKLWVCGGSLINNSINGDIFFSGKVLFKFVGYFPE